MLFDFLEHDLLAFFFYYICKEITEIRYILP